MELEEMKTLWTKMSLELEKQTILTDKIILEMTQEKYNNRISKISKPETIGTIVCFGMALYILFNMNQLDTWYLLLCGILIVAYLIILPVAVLISIKNMRNISVITANYKETILKFAKSKRRFLQIQKVGIYLNFLLIIIALPVAGKIMNDKDLFLSADVWLWYLPLGALFLFLFSKWGYNYYERTTTMAEQLLMELEEEN